MSIITTPNLTVGKYLVVNGGQPILSFAILGGCKWAPFNHSPTTLCVHTVEWHTRQTQGNVSDEILLHDAQLFLASGD